MFNLNKKEDRQLKKDVLDELMWDPSVTTDKIDVTAQDGVVTLRGSVPHYIEKSTAEKAALRVGGVKAVADEMEVNVKSYSERSDGEIAKASLAALEWSYQVPTGIEVSVDRAWITLRGEAEWDFQRKAAIDAVGDLMGVRGVTSEITLSSNVQKTDVKMRIKAALKRSAENEGSKIKVEVEGSTVILSGKVHSYSEIEDAKLAAWNAPGVVTVENNLQVEN